jgi:hypothetical protein
LFKDYSAAKDKYLKYKYQNYTIAYQSEQKRKIGIIQNFYKIQNSIYCVIQKLEKYKNIIDLTEETSIVIDYLDRFFLICKKSEQLDLIKIEDVISKCVLLHNNDEYFISIFNENDEIID